MNAQINPELPIPSVSIEALITRRAAALERIEQAADLLSEALRLCHGKPDIAVTDPSGRAVAGVDNPDRFIERCRQQIDQGTWSYLMNESGMLTFMDREARDKWRTQLNNPEELPPITAESVAATFERLHDSRRYYFDRGVLNCFRRLSWCYKTNSPCRFGKRIIVDYLTTFHRYTDGGGWFSHNQRATDELDDLMRIFHVLDGKPEPDHRGGISCLMHDHEDSRDCANDYIHLKWFKKGTGHVTFLRPDLVDRLNDILAKHHPDALPPRA